MRPLTLLLLRTSSRCQRLSATLTFPGSWSTSVPEPWLIFRVGVPSISSGWRERKHEGEEELDYFNRHLKQRTVWDIYIFHSYIKNCKLTLWTIAVRYLFAHSGLFPKKFVFDVVVLAFLGFFFMTVTKHQTKLIVFYFLTYSNGKLKVNELVKIACVLCTLCKEL